MSNNCSSFDFEKQFQSYLGAYALADQWQRGDAMKDFLSAIGRLHYFNVTRMEVTPKNHPMIEVRGQFSLARRLPELVQIDLSNVWNEATSSATHAIHAFERTAAGFEGRFMAIYGTVIFTYSLQVMGGH